MVRTFALILLFHLSLVIDSHSMSVYKFHDSLFEEKIPDTCFGFLRDMKGEYDVLEVLKNGKFTSGKTHVPVQSGGPQEVWLKLSITNYSSTEKLLLEYRVPLVEHIAFYSQLDSGVFEPQMVTGINLVSKKKYKEPMYYFDLNLSPGYSRTYLVHIRSNEPLWFPMRVVEQKYLHGPEVRARQLLHGAFAGIMLVMLVFNLLIFLSTRDTVYGIYVAYLLFASITQFGILGLYQNYFPIFGESYNAISWSWSMVGTGFTGIYFFERFLEMRRIIPFSRYFINFLYGMYGLTGILLALGYRAYFFILVEANAMMVSLIFMPLFAYMAYVKKVKKAKLMLYAWSVLMIGIFLYMLKDYGLIPSNTFTDSAIIVGAALQTLLFSLVLGDIINKLKKEKSDTQHKNSKMKLEHEQLQLKLKEIQLGSLQQQMNPHFISNALNSVQSYLVKDSKASASKLVSLFSKLMRTSLIHSRAETVSIRDEVEFLTRYLQIEQQRFPEKFNFQISIEPEVDQDHTMIPPLLIQPLCENCVKHAFGSEYKNGLIEVHFERHSEASIRCTIRDNGIGMNKSNMPKKTGSGKSVGMNLVMQRIEILTSQGLLAALSISDMNSRQGTEVQLILPDYNGF